MTVYSFILIKVVQISIRYSDISGNGIHDCRISDVRFRVKIVKSLTGIGHEYKSRAMTLAEINVDTILL
jgi:hypothetical protein